MRRAFTLIELIFVVAVIGILAGVAGSMFKTNYLRNDTDLIVLKIRQSQYKGIGYEHNGFGLQSSVPDYENGCIDLNSSAFQASASSGVAAYSLHVDAFDGGILCFDAKGRPHENNFASGTLLTEKISIDLSYRGETKTIVILPKNGFVIIK
ncbi:MAG: prepilin-type N-terminal cleavage/methylation domain-containing protein [Thiovulaceae bacterium]|nr:prepilin-type N-terminal cleavage/methylation domain-containing protein [Sulfurimonadaceae bacterium]